MDTTTPNSLRDRLAISADERREHQRLLLEVTNIPTASGEEHGVGAYVLAWAEARPDVELMTDACGNFEVRFANEAHALELDEDASTVDFDDLEDDDFSLAGEVIDFDAPREHAREPEHQNGTSEPRGTHASESAAPRERPIYFTAHMDHPALVVERIVAPGIVQLQLRGGVMDDYIKGTRVRIFTQDDTPIRARITEPAEGSSPHLKSWLAEIEDAEPSEQIAIGDIATWDVGESEIVDGVLHAPVCDDLAALAAAMCAFDVLRRLRASGERVGDVRLLLTRAEEIGFVGAIGACMERTMPENARVIALENSRAFDDSPIGGGPIVRVGDRLSVFSPTLTGAVAKVAEDLAGGPATPTASQKLSDLPVWRWQRKLMAGGACEATVFCTYAYEATCLCLPLGNYHNMGDLTAVQAGTNTTTPTLAREFIGVSDFEGMVDLLAACGVALPDAPPLRGRMEKLWDERRFVLGNE